MSRLPRLALARHAHLVLQRTLPAQPAFVDDTDRAVFVNVLRSAAAAAGVAIHAYALFDREVRLLATPAEASGLSAMMQAVGRLYVAGFNRRHGRRGTLWDGRFRATVVDDATALVDAMRFVETPPPEAGLAHPADHPWSSAAHHVGRQASPLVSEHPGFWRLGNTPFEREALYRRLLEDGLPAARRAQIEAATLKGWALGPPEFAAALGAQTPRPVAPRRRGRPKKVAV